MNDEYRISETAPAGSPRGALRPALWFALIVTAAADAVLSMAGRPWVSSAFGVVALTCAAVLIVHHYRGRAR